MRASKLAMESERNVFSALRVAQGKSEVLEIFKTLITTWQHTIAFCKSI
jgi:hypothetical protein